MTQTALTRDQVLAMEPGQELNELVARKVMGWQKGDSWGGAHWVGEDKCYRDEVAQFRPSQHINVAWEVEEEIIKLSLRIKYCESLKWVVIDTGEYVGMFDYIHATPEQRCKAALLAVLDI